MDSYYETILKSHILLGDSELMSVFEVAYLAIQTYTRRGPWNIEVDMESGQSKYFFISSLQAFWPALQTLFGQVSIDIYVYIYIYIYILYTLLCMLSLLGQRSSNYICIFAAAMEKLGGLTRCI